MRFKNGPQLHGAGRTVVGHHHGSHTLSSPGTVLQGEMANHTKQICRQCRNKSEKYCGHYEGNRCIFMFLLQKLHSLLTKFTIK